VETAILARHAESEPSARGTVSSDPQRPASLTAAGREQSRELGRKLAGESIGVCIVTELERTRLTAELALAGRGIPIVVVPDLNDPLAGDFEGVRLADYRAWSWEHGSGDEPPGGGESRFAVASRLGRGYRAVLDRDEPIVLVVGHALPMAYVLAGPSPRVDMVEYVKPYRLSRRELEAAVDRLEAWVASPTW
jgi:2,3-bisphosphoglycerate-dependent phosphoglycerate mutase